MKGKHARGWRALPKGLKFNFVLMGALIAITTAYLTIGTNGTESAPELALSALFGVALPLMILLMLWFGHRWTAELGIIHCLISMAPHLRGLPRLGDAAVQFAELISLSGSNDQAAELLPNILGASLIVLVAVVVPIVTFTLAAALFYRNRSHFSHSAHKSPKAT